MKKLPISKYDRLYINVAKSVNGGYMICWYPQWLGATNRAQAVKLRKEFFEYLQTAAPDLWKKEMLKTMRLI